MAVQSAKGLKRELAHLTELFDVSRMRDELRVTDHWPVTIGGSAGDQHRLAHLSQTIALALVKYIIDGGHALPHYQSFVQR
jgi:hypothetical protein